VIVLGLLVISTWAHAGVGMWTSTGSTGQITALAVAPSTPTTLYTGTDHGRVFKSMTGGDTWVAAASSGLPDSPIRALAIDPVTPTTLYVVTRIVIDDTTPASTTTDAVFKTTNSGDTWTAANTGFPSRAGDALHPLPFYVTDLLIDPATPTTLYAATDAGVFKTTNSGDTWAAIDNGFPFPFAVTLAIDPATPTTLYAAADDGVFKTTDGGDIWTAITNGLPSPLLGGTVVVGSADNILVIDPTTPTTLYVATAGGMFKTINGGEI
jgi:photosystem II stability/assembly factor-like uncharacterized protein